MPRLRAANNAKTTLAAAIDAVQTSFQVTDSSLFPDPPFRITVDAEIMEVGAIDRATNTFSSVTRGVEGTTAAPHSAGASVENRFTAGTLAELADKAQDVDPKFHATTGHKHSGAAGDAPPVPWANVSGKPTTFPPSAHKSTHASGGSDALSPSDIGAAPSSHTHTRSQITDFPHKSTHASGGSDALSPADIGAAPSSHTHSPSQISPQGAGSGLNADMVDQLHASDLRKIATGSYTGDGTEGRLITVGFTPVIVVVSDATTTSRFGLGLHSSGKVGLRGLGSYTYTYATLSNRYRPDITTNGFIVSYGGDDNSLNALQTYYWIAIG